MSEATVQRDHQYGAALDALDERGVINKADVLSGQVKIPAKWVVQAAKAETPEEVIIIPA